MNEADGDHGVEVLAGGIANAGAVLRVGDEVWRPTNAHSPTILALLDHLHDAGFDGASVPIGVANGRERLSYIPGEVAVPAYPAWAQTDDALISVARLLRRFHAAADSFRPGPGATWSDELADLVAEGIARGGRFLQRQVERGDPNFVALWQSLGGSARFDRRRSWFARSAPDFRRALGLPGQNARAVGSSP